MRVKFAAAGPCSSCPGPRGLGPRPGPEWRLLGGTVGGSPLTHLSAGSLSGMTRRAVAGLALAGLFLTACSTPGFSSPDPTGTVTSSTTDPAGATDAGTAAPDPVEVPDLVGMDGASAVTALDGAGLGATGTFRNSDTVPDESLEVVQQVPGAGDTVPAGDDIVLILDVPSLPGVVVQETDDALSVWVDEDLDERQVGWIVTDLMKPDRVPSRLDDVVEDRPAGTYSVVFKCEDLEATVLAEATFTVDAPDVPSVDRRTADQITMADGATCA